MTLRPLALPLLAGLLVATGSLITPPRAAFAALDEVTTYVTIAASSPFDVEFGPDGYLYVCGQQSASTGKVWKVGPGGGPVTEFASGLGEPKAMAFDADGNLYVSDWRDRVLPSYIWKITPAGVKSVWVTVPGATFMQFNNAGDLLVGTWGSLKVVKVTPAGVISNYATVGASGEEVAEMVYDKLTDELYVGAGPWIKKVGPGGTQITNIAGGMVGIYGLARGPRGEFYASRYSHRDLFLITPGGAVSTYAGAHLANACTDGPRLAPRFSLPAGLAMSSQGLFIADFGCHSIRTIDYITPTLQSSWGRVKTLYR
jgi:hypothetical protein